MTLIACGQASTFFYYEIENDETCDKSLDNSTPGTYTLIFSLQSIAEKAAKNFLAKQG